jgi:hypothetical protein
MNVDSDEVGRISFERGMKDKLLTVGRSSLAVVHS